MTTTQTLTQKQIVSWIDRAASRAEMIDATPATSKQCWYLAGLIARLPADEAERLISAMPGGMTRAEIEAELKARAIPYSAKSLQTQLSERLRRGALVYRDGRYSFPTIKSEGDQ